MKIIADLHCHSNFSDGTLTPEEVVHRAKTKGVTLLALTDHDELDGVNLAANTAATLGMGFVSGVEISTMWRGTSIHVLGHAVDQNSSSLRQSLMNIQQERKARGKKIAEKLEEAGVVGALAGAMRYSNQAQLGRMHFARFLHEAGYASSLKNAFERYLAEERPAYVPLQCATIAQAIAWIHDAGGTATLAHPGRYPAHLVPELLPMFRDLGGEAIEVCHSAHTAQQIDEFAGAARRLGFLASRGSDFHHPGEAAELNRVPPLPENLRSVWSHLGFK